MTTALMTDPAGAVNGTPAAAGDRHRAGFLEALGWPYALTAGPTQIVFD
jgi:hypothetical protein